MKPSWVFSCFMEKILFKKYVSTLPKIFRPVTRNTFFIFGLSFTDFSSTGTREVIHCYQQRKHYVREFVLLVQCISVSPKSLFQHVFTVVSSADRGLNCLQMLHFIAPNFSVKHTFLCNFSTLGVLYLQTIQAI